MRIYNVYLIFLSGKRLGEYEEEGRKPSKGVQSGQVAQRRYCCKLTPVAVPCGGQRAGVLSSAANHKDWDGETGIPVCAGSMGSLGPPEGSPLMKTHKHRLLVNKSIPPGNCGY